MIQTNRGAGSVFQTTVGSPAIFKEELPSSQGNPDKIRYVQHLVVPGRQCLVGEWLSYKRSSNCLAQTGASNMAGPLSDGYTVQGRQ